MSILQTIVTHFIIKLELEHWIWRCSKGDMLRQGSPSRYTLVMTLWSLFACEISIARIIVVFSGNKPVKYVPLSASSFQGLIMSSISIHLITLERRSFSLWWSVILFSQPWSWGYFSCWKLKAWYQQYLLFSTICLREEWWETLIQQTEDHCHSQAQTTH